MHTTTIQLFVLRLSSRFRDVNGSTFFLEDGASCGGTIVDPKAWSSGRTLRWSAMLVPARLHPCVAPCQGIVPSIRGEEMRRWLRRRRERIERIETEADELVRLLGDDAYSEARWREHTASSSASAQEWNLIALAIARQTGRRIGLDLSTPTAMNASPSGKI